MDDFFLILTILSLSGLLIAIAGPKDIQRFLSFKLTRLRAGAIFLGSAVIFFIAFGLTTEQPEIEGTKVKAIRDDEPKPTLQVNDGIRISSDSIIHAVQDIIPNFPFAYNEPKGAMVGTLDYTAIVLFDPKEYISEALFMITLTTSEHENAKSLRNLMQLVHIIDSSAGLWLLNQFDSCAAGFYVQDIQGSIIISNRKYKFTYAAKAEIPNIVISITSFR